MDKEKIKSALEALMFTLGEPVEAKAAAELFNITQAEALALFRELKNEYKSRNSGLLIREIEKSFRFCTAPENDTYIRKFCTPVKEKRLSQAALEVLAVVAYRQPVTKGQIDSVRGIKSDRALEGLVKKGLIEEKGRSEGIGKPILYGTTKEFLAQFGFESLKDLPEIENTDTLVTGEYYSDLFSEMNSEGMTEKDSTDEVS